MDNLERDNLMKILCDYKYIQHKSQTMFCGIRIDSLEDLEKFQQHLNSDTRWTQISQASKDRMLQEWNDEIAEDIANEVFKANMVEEKPKKPRKPRTLVAKAKLDQ